jgi:hypothetical protein
VVDTFNNRSFIYEVYHHNNIQYSSPQYELRGLVDFAPGKRIDIDNNGFPDVILDTIISQSTRIRYIRALPNSKGYNYWGSKSMYDRIDYLEFYKNLGNFYFYNFNKDETDESVEIFRIEADGKQPVIEFSRSKYEQGRSNHGGRYYHIVAWSYDSYIPTYKTLYKTYILNNKKMSKKTLNPKKAIVLKKEFVKLVEYYLNNPKQLNIDFGNKK